MKFRKRVFAVFGTYLYLYLLKSYCNTKTTLWKESGNPAPTAAYVETKTKKKIQREARISLKNG